VTAFLQKPYDPWTFSTIVEAMIQGSEVSSADPTDIIETGPLQIPSSGLGVEEVRISRS